MNDSMHNSSSTSETGNQEEGQMMSVDGGAGASVHMQPTILTDLQLIYMLQQQQQQQQGGGGEGTLMLSPGSLPLLMSSCQVMALHPGMSQQFVSSSSAGTSPSSLARSPLLPPDGSIIWQHGDAEDQLSDNFDDEHHRVPTGFIQQQPQPASGVSQQPASPASRNLLMLQQNNHNLPQQQQQLTFNGNMSGYPQCYSVITSASTGVPSSGFAASLPLKVVVAAPPPKTSLAAPKKPLTPYMKFSKSIWQHVKSANPSMSVCEVGASIGRLWREMSDTDKQKYNDEFQREKAAYETELQSYLRATGLQASDLNRTKKKEVRDRSKPSAALTVTPNLTVARTVAVTSTASFASLLTSATGADVEGSRLPHISQMWSGHSNVQQLQTNPQIQNILKTVGSCVDTSRMATVETIVSRPGQYPANLSCPSSATAASGMPSEVPWAWLKSIEQTGTSRSLISDALDASQSAYIHPDQTSLNIIAIPTDQQRTTDLFAAAAEDLEPGEVVVEGFEQSSVAKVARTQNSGVASAHNMYNSYAVNPWNQYKLTSGGLKVGEAIFDREQILRTELIHLRGSLSEKTKEVDQLMKELEMAYALINKLQSPDVPQNQLPMDLSEEAGILPEAGVKFGEHWYEAVTDEKRQIAGADDNIGEVLQNHEYREPVLKDMENEKLGVKVQECKEEYDGDFKEATSNWKKIEEADRVEVSKHENNIVTLEKLEVVNEELTSHDEIQTLDEKFLEFCEQEEMFSNLSVAQEFDGNMVVSRDETISTEFQESAEQQEQNCAVVRLDAAVAEHESGFDSGSVTQEEEDNLTEHPSRQLGSHDDQEMQQLQQPGGDPMELEAGGSAAARRTSVVEEAVSSSQEPDSVTLNSVEVVRSSS